MYYVVLPYAILTLLFNEACLSGSECFIESQSGLCCQHFRNKGKHNTQILQIRSVTADCMICVHICECMYCVCMCVCG